MDYRKLGSFEGVSPRALAPKSRPRAFAAILLRSLGKPLLRILGAAATCAFLVGVSVQLIDRPVATWVHEHLEDSQFDWFKAPYHGHLLEIGPFSLIASPAQALGPLAVIVLAILAVATATGWRPKMRGRLVLVLCLSIFAALEINAVAKLVFGRTWPLSWLGDNPSWIRDGVFGFFLFHGGDGWASFPSGHTTVIVTPATLLWVVWPGLRIVWATTVAIVVVGLIGANYHFVSDIIGGLYLGAATGLGIAALMLSPKDRLSWSTLWNPAPSAEPILPAIDARPPPSRQSGSAPSRAS
jgi:membrane-associated phospholipid phosphatase